MRFRTALLAWGVWASTCRWAIADGDSPQPPDPSARPAVPDAAPWLKPWLKPAAPDLDPVLAVGGEASAELSLGAMVSAFSTATPMLAQNAEYGRFIASSTKQALSIEAIEKLNLVFDHMTPQFGSLGAGLRRVGRRSGTGFGSVDFERVSLGMALMSRGSNLDVGIGSELAFGVLTFRGSGLDVHVDAYFFAPTDLTGPNKMFVIGLGYVYCPMTGMRPGVRVTPPVERPPPDEKLACPEKAAYEAALVQHRRLAVTACNDGVTDACQHERDVVTTLSAKLTACEQGENVGPPEDEHDAPH